MSIRAAEEAPDHARELGVVLRAFLRRVGEPAEADAGCDLPCLVAACDGYKVQTPESFRAVLFEFFDDLARAARGQRPRRGGLR